MPIEIRRTVFGWGPFNLGKVEMDMFGGLKKATSRIAIAAALGVTFGVYMNAAPAKAADFGGDCCADLEERVAELEATTVRKGNKKVSVTVSGWVVKLGTLWDDGDESNFYVGDKDTTLSSHFQISGEAYIMPGWSAGYTINIEAAGDSASAGFGETQFDDNVTTFGNINTLQSYMFIKSDKYGTLNWGQLSQATDNVALLPDLSGTIIEANAVVFDGAGMFIRPNGAHGSAGLKSGPGWQWGSFLGCWDAGGGVGADCNGYPQDAVRYDSPTFGGFSLSTSYGEDDMFDVAVKYAGDWGNFKTSAAFGYTKTTDEGCDTTGTDCGNAIFAGGGGALFARDVDLYQVGASVMHVPSGLFVYGLYQNEQNNSSANNKLAGVASDGNDTDVFYFKAGIKKGWSPIGATVLFGEYGEYQDQFFSVCPDATCDIGGGVSVTGSTVQRYGLGVVQEIDSAAMHVFARWQHLDLDLDYADTGTGASVTGPGFEDLDLFQVGGVIFF